MNERLPITLNEQLAQLPPYPELDKITCGFHHNLITLMGEAKIPYILSEWRTKTRESMGFENGAPSTTVPFTDIHGVRIVLEEEYKDRLVSLLQEAWPTPESFPWSNYWRNYTVREYRGVPDFENLDSLRYSATHVNLYVPNGARFAEVQLYTPEQYLAAEIIRPAYDAIKKT